MSYIESMLDPGTHGVYNRRFALARLRDLLRKLKISTKLYEGW